MSQIESLEENIYERWALRVRSYLEQIDVANVLDDPVVPTNETEKLAYNTNFVKDDKTCK